MGPIFIYSVSRSGGTFLAHLLSQCVHPQSRNIHAYHENLFSKEHIEKNINNNQIILKRHPYALYMSISLINFGKEKGSFKVSDASHWSSMNLFHNEVDKYIDIVLPYENKLPVIKYEDYHNNTDYVFDFVKDKFDINVEEDKKKEFINKLGTIDNSLNYYKTNPEEYNKKFQRGHISVGKGDNLSNLRFLPYDFRDKFKSEVDPYVKALGYEPYDLSDIKFDPIVENIY